MLRKTAIFIALLLGLASNPVAVAQTVDPCQFGCPKEGCGCPDDGGGPIESEDSDDSDDDDSDDEDSGDDSDDDDSDDDSSGDLPA
jgi:hypothetical protein